MDGYSKDITIEEIEKLRSVFPQCVVEGKVKIDQLLSILGIYDERDFEKYEFTWKGKNECYKVARERTKATLLPCEDESVNFNNTQNVYIEGDNLEVLKILQQGYYNKIKMIYIDPPYNTGNDFVYKDDYKDSLENYKKIVNSLGKSNPETSGRFHTDWLNMMFPRLMLAHTLLKDDGVIFISIDDNEVDNLKKMCNEIFGENNFIAQFTWRRTDNQPNIGNIAKVKEYILCYSKNITYFSFNRLPLSEKAKNEYRYSDENGQFRRALIIDKTRGRHFYNITTPNGKVLNGPFMIKEEDFKELEKNNAIYWSNGKEEQPYGKIYLKDSKGQIPNDFLGIEYGTNQRASLEINDLFNKRIFDFSKPTKLIKTFILLATQFEKDDIILDFFSGSATTAHAVMQLNAEDGGNRKYIMVQLPELCGEKTEAYKNGYKNICEIGKERIRRAGAKIKEEIEEYNKQLKLDEQPKTLPDIGFRVFKLDSTNFNRWDIPLFDDVDINEYINITKEIVDNRTEIDAMFEILIKNGFPLTEKIYSIDIDNYKFYYISEDCLVMISFEENIPIDVIEQAIEYLPAKLVLTMDAFEDTSAMVTAKHIINKDYSIIFEILGENDVN